MIAQELEVSLHMAFMEARQKRHEFITVEHLLLALLDNPSASEVLRSCAANVDELRKLTSRLALTEAQQRREFFSRQIEETRDKLTQAQLQGSWQLPAELVRQALRHGARSIEVVCWSHGVLRQ